MRITLELDDKLGEDIKSFCKLNNMKYTKYLTEIIESRFNIDRFGDLNEKIKPKKVKPQEVEMREVKSEIEEVKPVENTVKEETQPSPKTKPLKTDKKRQLKTL